jgi:hypothetical protein
VLEQIIGPLRSLDWEDIDAVEHATRKTLTAITEDPEAIRAALLMLPKQPELLRLCEHYDILDKIALYSDESGVGLRLHVFLPGYFDRPHNHRWSYASTILRGEYRHYLFGDITLDETINPSSLTALQVRQEPRRHHLRTASHHGACRGG